MYMLKIFLPSQRPNLTLIPFTWVIGLVAFEIGIDLLAAVVLRIFGSTPQSWIGIVGAMTASMTYAMLAEQRNPGALNRLVKYQLAAFSTLIVAVIGFAAVFVAAEKEFALDSLIVWAFIIFALLVSFGVHVSGMNQGIRMAKKVAA
jgi:hypothetical protein